MGPTLNFLTAAFLVAQSNPVVVVPASSMSAPPPAAVQTVPTTVMPTMPSTVVTAPSCGCANKGPMMVQETVAPPAPPAPVTPAHDPHPIMTRLKQLFGGNSKPKQDVSMVTAPAPSDSSTVYSTSSGTYMKKMPSGIEPAMLPPSSVPSQMAPASSTSSKVSPISYTVPAATNTSAAVLSAKFTSKVGKADDESWITGQVQVVGGGYVIHYAPPEVVDRFHGQIHVVADRGVDLRTFQNGDLICVHGGLVNQGAQTYYRATSADLIEHQ